MIAEGSHISIITQISRLEGQHATLPAAPPQALRATHTTRAPPCPACRLSLSFSQLLTLGYGAGTAYRGLGCPGPGDPATDPHSGIRDSLPSHGRSAASAFGARGSAASVSRPISGPPLHPVALSAPRSPGAGPPVSRDTGRAAVGRAGSFNSGKNETKLEAGHTLCSKGSIA